jgi:hypothetical protein
MTSVILCTNCKTGIYRPKPAQESAKIVIKRRLYQRTANGWNCFTLPSRVNDIVVKIYWMEPLYFSDNLRDIDRNYTCLHTSLGQAWFEQMKSTHLHLINFNYNNG